MSTTLSKYKEGVKVFGLSANHPTMKFQIDLGDLQLPNEEVPVTRNFSTDLKDIIGKAKLYKKDEGLYADITIHPDFFIVGGNPAIKTSFGCTVDEVGLCDGPNIDPTVKSFTFDIIRADK